MKSEKAQAAAVVFRTRDTLVRQRTQARIAGERALDRASAQRQLAPVCAELECHDDSGYDAQTESDAKNAQPEIEKTSVNRAAGRERQRLQDREPRRQPHHAGNMIWKETVNPVVLTPDLSKLKVVGLTHEMAESYAPMNITVSYAGQDGTPKPFLMIIDWKKVAKDWRIASETILPVPPAPAAKG